MRRQGYSLVELMVSIAIAGIVMAAAIPNLRSYRETQRLQCATEVVAAAVSEARSRARSRNMSVILEYRRDDGVVALIEDEDGDGVADDSEHVELYSLDQGLTLAATSFTDDKLVFDDRGTAESGGSVFLTGADGLAPKRVRISPGTGHVSVRAVTNVGDED
jgi:prepilin-type N-terminal cleavage/methylation domain-containing protein